jgi:energy-coupling factor transport system permease protein
VLPFAAGSVFAMASFQPVYAGISLLCAAALALKIRGFKDLKRIAGFCVLLTTATVLINGAFNSNGFTPLMSVGPFSIMWEPVFFGLCSAAALCAMVLWFASYSAVIDGEKFMFLAARLSPSAALLLSMTLSQAAIMRRKYRDIDDAQSASSAMTVKSFVFVCG